MMIPLILQNLRATSGTAYTLDTTPGSYSITGQPGGLNAQLLLAVTPGAYSVSGQSAGVVATRALATTSGAYSLAGSSAALTGQLLLATTPGSYTVTGFAADLTKVVNYVLDTVADSYALAGNSADLTYTAKPSNFGFQMGARVVTHKTLLQQIQEARAKRIKPLQKRARKRAKVIEIQAAELVQSGGNEQQFYVLMEQWLAQKPPLYQVPEISAEQLFMAQVGIWLQRLQESKRLFDLDEEEALIALLA